MGLAILVEDLVVLVVDVEAVVLGGLLRHLDAAVGHEGALERLVGLQAHDLLEVLGVLADVARAVGGQARDDLGLALENAAVGALGGLELLDLVPELVGGLGRLSEEGLVAVVGGVVLLDEVADVDVVHPVPLVESVPLFAHLHECSLLYARISCIARGLPNVSGAGGPIRSPRARFSRRGSRDPPWAALRPPNGTGCRVPPT